MSLNPWKLPITAIMTIALILCIACPSNAETFNFGNETTIVVGADNNYPPYEYLENGVPTGFDIDIIKAVAKEMNLNIVINMAPWNKIRKGLDNGSTDVIIGMSYSKEREKEVDFSTHYVVISHSIFVRSNFSKIKSVDDLKNKEIIVQKNDIMNDFVVENHITDKITTVENPEQAINLLSSGKHDAALLPKIQGFYFMKKNSLSNVTSVGDPITVNELGFAVKKGNEKLLTQLNEGLKILKTNGEYERIYNKWFGVYDGGQLVDKIIRITITITVIIFIALLVVGLWSWSLRKEVQRKTNELVKSNDEIKKLNQYLKEANFNLQDMNIVLEEEISVRNKIQNKLIENEKRFHNAIEEAAVPMMIFLDDGEILKANDLCTELLGYDSENMLTLTDWLESALGLSAEEGVEHLKSIFETLKTSKFSSVQSISNNDGTLTSFEYFVTEIGSSPDGRRMAMATAVDASKRRR